jgi:hypothetical protein
MEFVFIIGIARTGSKIYMNILNKHSEIDVLTELHFLAPRWVRKDFRYYVKKNIGNINTKNDVLKLMNLMYSGTLNGTFWVTDSEDNLDLQNRITGLDKDKLTMEILNSTKSYKEIFKILMEQHAIARNKKKGGAKFPVDIAFVPDLINWFPDSKFVHIIRDPRAVYSSMVLSDLKQSSTSKKRNKYLIGLLRLFYLWRQYKKAMKLHRRFKNMSNYYISRFEDIILRPEKYLKQLCEFLEIDFKENMMFPPVVDSSFGASNKKIGFDKNTLTRWKTHISHRRETLIKLLLRKEMKEMGYH